MEDKVFVVKRFAANWGVKMQPETEEAAQTEEEANPINTPRKTPVRANPFVTPQKAIENPVIFDPNVFYLSKDGKGTGLCQSTASTNKCRARSAVKAALEGCGTLAHQAAAILDVITVGEKAGIGVALGVVEDPDRNLAVAKEITRNTTEIFQSDLCLLYTSPSPRDGLLSRMPSSA